MANEQNMEARLKALEEKNAKLMAALEAKWESAQPAGGIDAAQLEKILIKVSEASAGPAQVLASKLKPENADHLHRSAFEHAEGGLAKPKPPLKREIVFGRPLPIAELTYAEVLALNALSDSLGRSQRRIARDGKWTVQVSDDDRRLTIKVPVRNIDDRYDLPSFIEIVQELTTGERVMGTADLVAELALLKAQMAELQGAGAR